MGSLFSLYLLFATLAAAQTPKCTQGNDTAFCETPVHGLTRNNIIYRCEGNLGSPTYGNCNDELANVPPVGFKYTDCWETSPTSGDAQCTYDCVSVTAANGTTFYPLGCKRKNIPPFGGAKSPSPSSSSSLISFGPSTPTTSTTSSGNSPTSKSGSIATGAAGGNGILQVLAIVVGALAL